MTKTTKILATLGIIGVASAAGLGVNKVKVDKIPEPLKLKVPKERVFAKSNFYVDGQLTVKYNYVSESTVSSTTVSDNDPKVREAVKKVKFKDKKTGAIAEDLSRRTGNAKFYVLGTDENNKEVVQGEIYSGQQFIKDLTNNTWYHLETTTTTKEQFDAQTQVTAFDVIKQWIYPKAYADSATFYPDPHTETTSVDGRVSRIISAGESFSTLRDSAGNNAADSGTTIDTQLQSLSTTTPNLYRDFSRGIFLFDTSSLPDDATISNATISFYGSAKFTTLGSPDFHVASSSPASNTALANSDYGNIGRLSFGSIANASFSTSGYNDITLDSNGIGVISLTGISKYSTQISWDINNSFGGTWGSFKQSLFRVYGADQTGTTKDPKLTVTYTSSGGSAATPAYIQFE